MLRQVARTQRKEIAEAHAEPHARLVAKLDAVEIATGNAIEHARMNVRVARRHAQMIAKLAQNGLFPDLHDKLRTDLRGLHKRMRRQLFCDMRR